MTKQRGSLLRNISNWWWLTSNEDEGKTSFRRPVTAGTDYVVVDELYLCVVMVLPTRVKYCWLRDQTKGQFEEYIVCHRSPFLYFRNIRNIFPRAHVAISIAVSNIEELRSGLSDSLRRFDRWWPRVKISLLAVFIPFDR